MARKTTPATNGRRTRPSISLPIAERKPAPNLPQRGRKPKLSGASEATTSLADQFFPGGDEPADAASTTPEEPVAKPRRGRKPKEQAKPMPAAMDEDETATMAERPAKARRGQASKVRAGPVPAAIGKHYAPPTAEAKHNQPEPPAKARRGRKPKADAAPDSPAVDDDNAAAIVAELEQAQPSPAAEAMQAAAPGSSAAHWDAATGSATFNWTAIEQVAAHHGPNQAMAKLLLAARAEGANSRWPF